MTSTPVTSDVASILSNLTTQPAKNDKAGENFSDVLSKQTQSEPGKEPNRTENTKPVKVENRRADKVKDAVRTEDAEASASMAEDETKVNEAAQALAEQMLQSVADELGISVEELEKVLEELGMTMMDLLQSDNLMQVFVVAGGAEDAISLLTNEDMYASYMKLSEQLTEGLKEIADAVGMEVNQLQDYLSQISMTDAEDTALQAEMPEDTLQINEPAGDDNVTVKDAPAAQTEEVTVVKQTADQAQTENGKEESKDQGNVNKGNSFMVTGQVQQQVEVISNGVRYTEAVYSTETQMIMDQIMEFMKIQVGEGITRLEMQLQPESLGTVQVQIAAKDGVITAQFTAQNEMVKNALESQMIQLKDTFETQGIKVESIEVAVQSQAFDRNLHQGRGQQGNSSQESKSSNRVRRLNLNALEEGMDEILDEADRLAAQMMEQNGNTVDYTV